MYPDVTTLKQFYSSYQGRMARRMIGQKLRHNWRNVRGLSVAGFGYAIPYLRPYIVEADVVTALLPEKIGVDHWPEEDDNLTCLCEEKAWPIETHSIDRLLVVHALHSQENLDIVLKESFRVLKGEGRLMLVVPNRSGIWAWFDHTPFGQGTPWSMRQIKRQLRQHMFIPKQEERALFVPPVDKKIVLSTAFVWERLGSALFDIFGGVNIIEAQKQIYSVLPRGTAPATHKVMTAKPVIAGGDYDRIAKTKRRHS